MNRLFLTSLLLCLGLLTGCNVYVTPTPAPPAPALKVLEASYSTSFSTSDGRPAICDNKPTQLTYTFRYEGRLESWSSYLEGQVLGKKGAERSFTPTSAGVSRYQTNGYEVTYGLPTDFTPYGTDPETNLSAQAIVVTPIPPLTPIGATKLYLTLIGAGGTAQPYVSKDIVVYINCP